MALGLKLYVYRMNFLTFPQLNVLNDVSVAVYGQSITVPFTKAELDNYDALYHIKGRKVYVRQGTNVGLAKISSWIDNLIYTTLWINYQPVMGFNPPYDTAYMSLYITQAQNPLTLIKTLDVSYELIKEDLSVTFEFESDKKFDLNESYGSISVYGDFTVQDLMQSYWKQDDGTEVRYVFGVELLRDGQPEFWAVAPPDDIEYDKIKSIFTFKCFGWYKYIYDTIGNSACPAISTFNVSGFLSSINLWNSMHIDTGTARQNFRDNDYNYYYYNGNFLSVQEEITLGTFINEMQKHYAAFIFYDKDKSLQFLSRNVQRTAHGDIFYSLVKDSYIKTYRPRYYNKLIMTVYGDWYWNGHTYETWYGWAELWEENGQMQIKTGLSDADLEKQDYLDLRQKLYGEPIFVPTIFQYRNRADVFEDYRDLLKGSVYYTCTVNSLDFNLLDTAELDGWLCSVRKAKKNYAKGTSELTLVNIKPTYPNPFN